MGLLDKVDAKDAVAKDARAVITDFCQRNPLFHCIVLKHGGDRDAFLKLVAEMTEGYGAACGGLSGKNGMVLLPGRLDMELFSHRVSKSTGSSVVLQFSTDSPAVAFDTLRSYLP